MDNLTFSIITVSYNSERTIERTIKSVLNQSCKDYEYIIVDGASNDSTIDIIKRYEPLFEGRLKWKSEPDKGIYNAMNKGIKQSSGKIIGIVNSDDWLNYDALHILKNELENNECARNKILTGEVLFHYEDASTQLFPTSLEKYEYYSKKYRMGLNHPATFVPRRIYEEYGLFDERFKLYADADFIIRCYKANVGIYFIHRVLSNMSDGGASNSSSRYELSDTYLKYKKHSSNTIEYYYLCIKAWLYILLKSVMPFWYIIWYRRRRNKK